MLQNFGKSIVTLSRLISGRLCLPAYRAEGAYISAALAEQQTLGNFSTRQPSENQSLVISAVIGSALHSEAKEALPKVTVGGLVNAPPRYASPTFGNQHTGSEQTLDTRTAAVDLISTFKRKKAKIKRERKATVRKRLMKKSQRKREKLNL